ncbi:hypothetical protein SEMRO_342_G121730.1 [Seminavis robusta]|uniref:Uncharacterized protein n=1 Tax=Seminavis robusta TaxID=568900 RepID=A0A9N8HB06_9STRA|nr:hypothetical protein SEMRO_342_G121730.1 [Seminavis robusta]|eukprot:Sro342_g121730.1 n/a (510) ;mRNA; r:35625-37154
MAATKKKTAKKKAAPKKQTRTTPVRGGGGGDDPPATPVDIPEVACGVHAGPEVLASSGLVTCNKFFAPTMILRIFVSDDITQDYHVSRKRATLTCYLVSGMRPEDCRVIQRHQRCGTQFVVRWRIPKELRTADFIMARHSVSDPDGCRQLDEFLRTQPEGWQEHSIDLGFQTEGFFRALPSFLPAKPEEIHLRWQTPPIAGKNGHFRAACVFVTAYEVDQGDVDERYDDLDNYTLEEMSLADVERSRGRRGRNVYQPAAQPRYQPPRQQPRQQPRPHHTPSRAPATTSSRPFASASRTPPHRNYKQQSSPKPPPKAYTPPRHTPTRGKAKDDRNYEPAPAAAAAASKPAARQRPTPPRPGRPYKEQPSVREENHQTEMEIDDLPKTSFEEANSGRYYNGKPYGGVTVEDASEEEQEPAPPRTGTPKRHRAQEERENEYEPPSKMQSYDEDDVEEEGPAEVTQEDDGYNDGYGDNYASDASDDDTASETEEESDQSYRKRGGNWLNPSGR